MSNRSVSRNQHSGLDVHYKQSKSSQKHIPQRWLKSSVIMELIRNLQLFYFGNKSIKNVIKHIKACTYNNNIIKIKKIQNITGNHSVGRYEVNQEPKTTGLT